MLLVHPGGPFWAKKDLGAWSIPKGEIEEGEEPLQCALRELEEELGSPRRRRGGADRARLGAPEGEDRRRLGRRGRLRPGDAASNTFAMEWPPRSGNEREFPEVDRAEWFGLGAGAGRQDHCRAGLESFLDRSNSRSERIGRGRATEPRGICRLRGARRRRQAGGDAQPAALQARRRAGALRGVRRRRRAARWRRSAAGSSGPVSRRRRCSASGAGTWSPWSNTRPGRPSST